MATQSSLSLLTCEVLRLRQMEAKLPTRGNKAALVQRLLAHEGACDSELSEEDEQDGESSSSSSENREPSDPVPTDGPSGSRLPCGSGSRAPPGSLAVPGGLAIQMIPRSPAVVDVHSDPSRSAPPDERLPSESHRLHKAGRCSASLSTRRIRERRVPDPAQVNPRVHTPARVSVKCHGKGDAGRNIPEVHLQQGARLIRATDVLLPSIRVVILHLPPSQLKPHLSFPALGPGMPTTVIIAGGVRSGAGFYTLTAA